MTTLFFQTCYTDTEGRHRYTTEYQADGERVTIMLEDHEASIAGLLSSYVHDANALQPGYTVPETADPPVKTSTYLGTDGMRHTTMTTQGPGESEQDWQARHDAAHAALQALFPPAS